MVTCPECGRANKEGSKFCIQCGRTLTAGARPAGGVPRWGNDIVPDWLLDLQGHLPEELRDPELEQMARLRHAPGAVEAPTTAPQAAQRSDWLSSLRDQAGAPEPAAPGGKPVPPKEDADTWLQGVLSATKSAETGPGVVGEGEEKLPDWLTDLRSSMYDKTQPVQTVPKAPEGEEPEDEPAEPAEMEIPDWLRSESYQKDVTTATQSQQTAPPEPPTAVPAEHLADLPLGQDDVPDWLKNIDTGVPPAPSASASGLAQAQKADVEPPDWLKHFEDIVPELPAAPSAAGSLAPAQKAETEPPEWLRDISGPAGVSQPALPELGQPSWLADSGPESAAPGARSRSEIPDWLRSLQYPGAGVSEAESPALESSAPGGSTPAVTMPDWLQGTSVPAPEPPIDEEPFEAAPQVSQVPVPDWLKAPAASAEQLPPPEPPGASPTPVPDWLRGPDQAAAAALAKSPVPSEEETPASEEQATAEPAGQLPDWLRSFRQESPARTTGELAAPESFAEPPSEEALPETQIPDWVLKSGEAATSPASVPITEESPVAGEPAPEPEAPSWLADLAAQRADEPPLPPAEETAPEWPETSTPAASPGPVQPATLPPPPSPEPGFEPPEAGRRIVPPDADGAAEVEMPEWLRNMRAQTPFNQTMEPPAWVTSPEVELPHEELPHEELPHVEEETPPWLAAVPAVPGPEIPAADVPEWLRELDQKTPVTPPGGVALARPEIESEFESEEGQVPDWLRQMGAIDPSAELPPEPAPLKPAGPQPSEELRPPVSPFERIGGLSAKPPKSGAGTGTPPPAAPAASRLPSPGVVGTGTPPPAAPAASQAPAPTYIRRMSMAEMLSGVSGALAVEQAIAASKPGHPTATVTAEAEKGPEASAFEDIVNEPLLASSDAAVKSRRQFWPWFGQLVLSLLIIGAVVVPLTWQGDRSFFSEYNIPISPRTVQFYDQVNALQAGSPVWVVLDYDPSLSAELNTQAHVLLGHLMQRKVRLFVISTTPTGPEIAQRLLDTLAAQPANSYVYGKDYVNLGYLPGQEASLSLFARSPLAAVRVDFKTGAALETFPIVAELKQAPAQALGKAFPLLIVLSGSQEGLRAWIEQVGASTGVKLMAGVTGGIEPYAQTYVGSNQLAGLLSGVPDAAEYEAQAKMPGLAVRSLDSQAGVHLLLVGLIVLANLVFGVRWLFSRRR